MIPKFLPRAARLRAFDLLVVLCLFVGSGLIPAGESRTTQRVQTEWVASIRDVSNHSQSPRDSHNSSPWRASSDYSARFVSVKLGIIPPVPIRTSNVGYHPKTISGEADDEPDHAIVIA